LIYNFPPKKSPRTICNFQILYYDGPLSHGEPVAFRSASLRQRFIYPYVTRDINLHPLLSYCTTSSYIQVSAAGANGG
jgi:hypothetical protein